MFEDSVGVVGWRVTVPSDPVCPPIPPAPLRLGEFPCAGLLSVALCVCSLTRGSPACTDAAAGPIVSVSASSSQNAPHPGRARTRVPSSAAEAPSLAHPPLPPPWPLPHPLLWLVLDAEAESAAASGGDGAAARRGAQKSGIQGGTGLNDAQQT